ncbi:hypothetical protein QBC39DRAFT_26978 [Podospora conica]|nr:hypothetical protein QBC39DRAFT_26978 [Schizothecium conicum]
MLNKSQDYAMFTPSPEPGNESAISDSAYMADSGYFGSPSLTCHRCSISSTATNDSLRSNLLERSATEPARVSTFVSQHPPPKLDAMHRTFPKPPTEPIIDELLARPPMKLSIQNSIQNSIRAQIAREARMPVIDKAKDAKALEDAKRALLLSYAAMKKPQGLQ